MLWLMITTSLIQGPAADAAEAVAASLVEQIRKGDWRAAADTARQLERVVAVRAPLHVVDIKVVAKRPAGLGMYSEIPDGTVRGDELMVYAQVRNYGMQHTHGFYEVHLVSDLIVLDSQGRELARDEGFGESRFAARAQHRDTFVVITMGTRGLPPGDYRLRVVLNDKIGRKQARGEVPFRVRRSR